MKLSKIFIPIALLLLTSFSFLYTPFGRTEVFVEKTVAQTAKTVKYTAPNSLQTALSAIGKAAHHGSSSERQGYGSDWLADVSDYGLTGCYFVTNSHVVNAGVNEKPTVKRIIVETYNLNSFGDSVLIEQVGDVVYDDRLEDIAIVKVAACEGLPRFKLDLNPQFSTPVYALGHPRGLINSVTGGIISHPKRFRKRLASGYVYVQTDAPINPGNSGGPLVDKATFKVVGMNVLVLTHETGRDGMGFAVHAATIDQAFKNYKTLGRPSYPKFGLAYIEVKPELANALHIPASYINANCFGVYVDLVVDGAVKKVGLKEGDVVLSLNGACVNNDADFISVVMANNTLKPFKLNVWRSSTSKVLNFDVYAKDSYEKPINPRLDNNEHQRVYSGYLGFDVERQTDYPTDKLVVTKVYQFSEAFWAQALRARAHNIENGKMVMANKPVLKNPLPYVGVDGMSIKSFQTIESVRDSDGRVLFLITKDGLENFARESALNGAKLVIEMRVHVLRANDYFSTSWTELSTDTHFAIFTPTQYVIPAK